MKIELALTGDIERFDNVADDVFDCPIDRLQVQRFLSDPRHHIAVAVEKDLIVGFASAVEQFHPDKLPSLFINEVGVCPDYQGRGIAKALLSKLLDHAKSLGCSLAWVLTEHDNEPANRLYRSLDRLVGVKSVTAVPNLMYDINLSSP